MSGRAGPLLDVRDLQIAYRVKAPFGTTTWMRAVDGVSLSIGAGEALALVGESGCGKSSTALGILRLIPAQQGTVAFAGLDVLSAANAELRAFRREAQIVFQDPFSSLHPRRRIADSLAEPFLLHTQMHRRERDLETQRLLELVGLDRAFGAKFPRECSGGQLQRIAIARAIALRPKLLILDEPLSSLDVSIRAQIMLLLKTFQQELDLSYLFISHDLALVRTLCQSAAVMYLGKIVEQASIAGLFEHPRHPYTQALIAAVPVPDPVIERARARTNIIGDPPNALSPPSGCRFHPRCSYATDKCSHDQPMLEPVTDSHLVSCHYWKDLEPRLRVTTVGRTDAHPSSETPVGNGR